MHHMDQIHFCTIMPDPHQDDFITNTSPSGDCHSDRLDLAMDKNRMWESGTTLRVQLLGGSPLVREKVVVYFLEWLKYANLHISWVTSGSADIRVGFEKGDGSWSQVGTDCRNVEPNKPTMNFGWFSDETPEEEFARTILHEFGHALGCIHEHSNPSTGIPWNKPAVYKYYEQEYEWEKAKVDRNILRAYDKNITQFSTFDETSIMIYPIPAQLTTNGYSTKWNKMLSKADKSFIAQAYPPSSGSKDDGSSSSIKRAKKSKKRRGRNQKEESERKKKPRRR